MDARLEVAGILVYGEGLEGEEHTPIDLRPPLGYIVSAPNFVDSRVLGKCHHVQLYLVIENSSASVCRLSLGHLVVRSHFSLVSGI